MSPSAPPAPSSPEAALRPARPPETGSGAEDSGGRG